MNGMKQRSRNKQQAKRSEDQGTSGIIKEVGRFSHFRSFFSRHAFHLHLLHSHPHSHSASLCGMSRHACSSISCYKLASDKRIAHILLYFFFFNRKESFFFFSNFHRMVIAEQNMVGTKGELGWKKRHSSIPPKRT